MTNQQRVVASLAIGFLGWFSPALSNFITGTLVIMALLGPIVTGAVGAAIGGGRGLPWLLLGFLLPPAVVLVVAYSSQRETSGFDLIQYTMLGLVLLCLGFYGWFAGHRIWMGRRTSQGTFTDVD
jgi:putative effector of murein hydrolase LrgA (UPF0299 family)